MDDDDGGGDGVDDDDGGGGDDGGVGGDDDGGGVDDWQKVHCLSAAETCGIGTVVIGRGAKPREGREGRGIFGWIWKLWMCKSWIGF